jgi:hypothetical protein
MTWKAKGTWTATTLLCIEDLIGPWVCIHSARSLGNFIVSSGQ